MITECGSAQVRSLRFHSPPRTRAWPSMALAKCFGRTSLVSSDDRHHRLDVTWRHAGVGRQRENARGDHAGPWAGLLSTRQVRADARNVSDRSRIGRARADFRLPEPPEQMRAMRLVPCQDREAQVDWAGLFAWSRNLDSLDPLDAGAQLVSVASANLVVRVEAREEPRGQPRLVRGEARDREIRFEARGAELEEGRVIQEPIARRPEHS